MSLSLMACIWFVLSWSLAFNDLSWPCMTMLLCLNAVSVSMFIVLLCGGDARRRWMFARKLINAGLSKAFPFPWRLRVQPPKKLR